MNSRREEIREFLIQGIFKDFPSVTSAASKEFGISRQAVNRYLRQLINDRFIIATGSTKDRKYSLRILNEIFLQFQLSSDLQEDKIWRENIRPLLEGVRDSVIGICQYGFTEIFNNAIEHSEGASVLVEVKRTAAQIEIAIWDDGVGIFHKIKREFGLDDERHAILELSKGKLTTDPIKHTGEGIFFTSRVFDVFAILSGSLFFRYTPDTGDWVLEDDKNRDGTFVKMEINVFSRRNIGAIFDKYTSGDADYGFSKTNIPVDLVRYGDENLVSRSQAKRLLSRLDRFKQIVLDFKDINMIGQAFADEIFRVFPNEHPDSVLFSINTSPTVNQMIQRVKSQGKEAV